MGVRVESSFASEVPESSSEALVIALVSFTFPFVRLSVINIVIFITLPLSFISCFYFILVANISCLDNSQL